MKREYYEVIQELARYEFGNGIYTDPLNTAQLFQVENLQSRIAEHYPDLKSAKAVLKEVKQRNERVL